MKSILRILVLGVVPVLAATAVVDQGLAADKGSQLIFRHAMVPEHQSFITIANAHDKRAVTVLVQYYNDAMERVLWYLRVLPADANFLVDPFDHMIPGSDPATNVGDFLAGLPAMSTDDEAGINSGHFVIAVTAVGTNVSIDSDDDGTEIGDNEMNQEDTANVLFPAFLVDNEDMGIDLHGVDNIDNCGVLKLAIPNVAGELDEDNNLAYTMSGAKGVNDCRADDPATDATETDETSKNVGDLNVGNAHPVSFNHLTGNFTEALTSSGAGGADQTASWGGTPIIRPAVAETDNVGLAQDVDTDADAATTNSDYQVLNGAAEVDTTGDSDPDQAGGRLAEKDAGGGEETIEHVVAGYTNEGGNMGGTDGKITNAAAGSERMQRGLNMGALVLPALFGGGDQAHQIMLLLSVADEFGGAGGYKLIAAKTGYAVTLIDGMGDALPNPAVASGPVFGGSDDPETPVGTHIIVEGIRVMTDANLAKCTGDMIEGPWMLTSLTDIVPTAASGAKDFDGLDAMMDAMVSASPGWIKFMRSALKCEKDFGDGDVATGSDNQDADGVPTTDKRTFTAGTLIVEEAMEDRAFVTTGQALLKFITPSSTFAASWSLKSPPSPEN